MERGNTSIILTLSGNITPNTILLYGPPDSGKTVLVNSDLPESRTVVLDTTSTFPIDSKLEVIKGTNIKDIISYMEPGKIIVIDDTFVLTANEVKQLFRSAIDTESILVLISQIRKFRSEKFYPYMETVMKNANIWLRIEPIEDNKEGPKIVEIIVERIRGEITTNKISIPIYIKNMKIDDTIYRELEHLK